MEGGRCWEREFFVTLRTLVVILFRFGSTFVLPLKGKSHRVHTVRLVSGLLYNTELTVEEEGESGMLRNLGAPCGASRTRTKDHHGD